MNNEMMNDGGMRRKSNMNLSCLQGIVGVVPFIKNTRRENIGNAEAE